MSLILPTTLNLQAIDVCNSRCIMCNVWRDGSKQTVSLDRLASFLRDPFFSQVLHVGITGGEPTLRRDLYDVYALLPEVLPKLKGASFITHGMQSERAVEIYTRTQRLYLSRGLAFSGMVSIDGLHGLHDAVRGREGAFGRATRTIFALKEQGVPVIAACTIVRRNVYGLHDLLNWGQENGIYVRFRIAEFIRRLYNDSCSDEIRAFNRRETLHLVSFFHLLLTQYEKDAVIRRTYESIVSLLTGGERLIQCPYGRGHAVNVDSSNRLACCAPKGEVREFTGSLDMAGQLLADDRSSIAHQHCAHCIHDYHDDWKSDVEEAKAADVSASASLYASRGDGVGLEKQAIGFDPAAHRRVLLVGWYGTETAGDIAILRGVVMEYVARNAALQFRLLSLYPYYTRATLDSWPADLRNRIEICGYDTRSAALSATDCDAVVMAGGPLMDIPEVHKILRLFEEFEKRGKLCVIEGCGIGPLNNLHHRWAVIRIARLATRISVRDHDSRDLLRIFGIRKTVEVRSDPATTYLRSLRTDYVGSGSRVIRCFLRELTAEYPQAISPQVVRTHLVRFLRCLLEWFPECEIELWAMHYFPVGNDDRVFAESLMREIGHPRLRAVWEPQEPSDIAVAMATAKFCVCMRFHSCVFATEVGVPFVAVDYTSGGKIQAFLSDTRQSMRLCTLAALADIDLRALGAKLFPSDTDGLVENGGVVHLIECLSSGGAARAMVSLAREMRAAGAFHHLIVSLRPAEEGGRQLADNAGVRFVSAPTPGHLRCILGNADIVLCHWWNSPELAAVFRRELPPMRLVSWIHVGGFHAPHTITPEILHYCDVSVACSPHTYTHPCFMSTRVRSGMVLAGADFQRLEGLLPQKHDGFVIGYIGTVDPVKMHPDFAKISLAVDIPSARFVVCGYGDAGWLTAQVSAAGAQDRFEFRGAVEDIRSALSEMDVYGYPLCPETYAAAELNLQEAMFAGVPVVAFAYGGIPLLVKHGETGFLVHSAEEYAAAIRFLFENPGVRERMGRNAAEYARLNWGAKNAAAAFRPLLEAVLGEPKKSRRWEPSFNFADDRKASIYVGARLFIESLGSAATPFITSMQGDDEQSLAADEQIATMPRGMQQTCAIYYRRLFPADAYLNLWAGLIAFKAGDAAGALQCFAATRVCGLAEWRIEWYAARAADARQEFMAARKFVAAVLAARPTFEPAIALQTRIRDKMRSPDSAETVAWLIEHAQRELLAGRIQSGRDDLALARLGAPNNITLLEVLADLECRLQNWASAQELLDTVLKIEPRRTTQRLAHIRTELRRAKAQPPRRTGSVGLGHSVGVTSRVAH